MPNGTSVNIAFVQKRLKAIRETLRAGDFAGLRFGPLAFLQKETGQVGAFRNIDAELRDLQNGVMDFDEGARGRLLVLSPRFMSAASKLVKERRLTHRQTIWMIDNFLVHEMLHEAQGMGGGLHTDLRLHSPQTLLAIDYQADAAAVLVAVILAWHEPKEFGFASPGENVDVWTLYREGILAVIHQMDIFTYITRRDLDRKEAAKLTFTIERLQRIAAWHFQYHRLHQFNTTLSLADFQILLQPGMDFRNAAAAALFQPSLLNKDWPAHEQAFFKWLSAETNRRKLGVSLTEREPLILTSSSPTGTTRFVRFKPASHRQYEDAFDGFFSADLGKSRRFFESLLKGCQWTTGGAGTTRAQEKRPQPTNTARLAMNLNRRQRSDLLARMLRPENHSIVFATT